MKLTGKDQARADRRTTEKKGKNAKEQTERPKEAGFGRIVLF
jgi:hypothetical protein